MVSDVMKVGVIQTSLNAEAAWEHSENVGGDWKQSVRISAVEENRAVKEIRQYLSSLNNSDNKPDIILLPELAVPLGFQKRLENIASSMQSIIIAGFDYRIIDDAPNSTVRNEALVIIPRKLRGKKISSKLEVKRVGKTHPSAGEHTKFSEMSVVFQSSPTVWLFESNELGSFGVAVCYDFMDLDRIVMYRGKVQTLFILAFNRDITSFDHIAEAIARMVFCNVVVCNCGHYGGSLAVCPYREPFERTIYRHSGMGLPNAQLVQLPIASMLSHQSGSPAAGKRFKSLPAGFVVPATLVTEVVPIAPSKLSEDS
ncbi:MAG: hypothetical protein P8P99_12805 [Maricaulis sp.]|nr:hypothetical protein [Maricaulis sp.]